MAEQVKQVRLMDIAIVCGMVYMLFTVRVPVAPGPGPSPGPDSSVDVIAATHQADIHDATHKAEAMEHAADQVDKKVINDAQGLMTELRRLTELGRTNAYYKDPVVSSGESLGQIDNAMIPWETYDESNRAKVSSYLRQKAKGHRSFK